MEVEIVPQDEKASFDRCYIGYGVLKNFRGHNNVEIHIFRPGAAKEEIEELKGKKLVGPADPNAPAEVLAGATEEAALRSILECFTRNECGQIAEYLKERYGDQIEKLVLCPIELPVPLGLGALEDYPQTAKSGFINFDEAKGYPLKFRMKAYYELE